MKEMKIRGKEIALHLIVSGSGLIREEVNEYGNKVYVFSLSDEEIQKLKGYIKKQQKARYY